MLDIKIQGESVDLPEDVKAELHVENSAMKDELISQDYVQQMRLPPTTANERIFDHANHVEVRNKAKVYEGTTVSFKGVQKIAGKTVLHRTTDDGFETSISANGFLLEILDKNLKDVNYGADVNLGADADAVVSHATTKAGQSYPTANYTFPLMRWLDFYDGSNPDFQNFVNDWDFVAEEFKKNVISQSNPDSVNTLVPCLYFHFVFTKVFENFGYHVKGDFINDVDWQKLIIIGNYGLDELEKGYFVRVSLSASYTATNNSRLKLDDDSTGDNEDEEGIFDTSTNVWEYEIQEEGFHTFTLTGMADMPVAPVGSLSWSFRLDATQVSPTYSWNWGVTYSQTYTRYFAAGEIGGKVWINIGSVGPDFDMEAAQLNVTNTSSGQLNVFSKTLHYANHVPDMTLGDLMSNIKGLPNLHFEFDKQEKVVYVNYKNDILTGPVKDWTGKQITGMEQEFTEKPGWKFSWNFDSDDIDPDDYKDLTGFEYLGEFNSLAAAPPTPTALDQYLLVTNENRIYVSKLNGSDEMVWDLPFHNFKPYEVAGEEGNTIEINPDITPAGMSTEFLDENVLVPAIGGKGSSPAFEVGINSRPFKIAFYYGLQPASGGTDYPMASSYNRRYDGTVIGNVTLRWDDTTYGLIALYWQAWMDFRANADKYTMDFDLNEVDVEEIDERAQYFVRGSRYVLGNVKLLYSLDALEVVRGEFWRVVG